jgi:hypothetical protein
MVKVSTTAELLNALQVADDIEVDGSLSGMPMITLRPGVTLRGGTLRFGAKGIRLTADNRLENVTVLVPDHEVAIGNDTAVPDLGRFTLRNVRTRGQVLLLDAVHLTGETAGLDQVRVTAAHGQPIVRGPGHAQGGGI